MIHFDFTDKCNEAITNAFKEFWVKEQVASSEDNKTGVAICFSYLRLVRLREVFGTNITMLLFDALYCCYCVFDVSVSFSF